MSSLSQKSPIPYNPEYVNQHKENKIINEYKRKEYKELVLKFKKCRKATPIINYIWNKCKTYLLLKETPKLFFSKATYIFNHLFKSFLISQKKISPNNFIRFVERLVLMMYVQNVENENWKVFTNNNFSKIGELYEALVNFLMPTENTKTSPKMLLYKDGKELLDNFKTMHGETVRLIKSFLSNKEKDVMQLKKNLPEIDTAKLWKVLQLLGDVEKVKDSRFVLEKYKGNLFSCFVSSSKKETPNQSLHKTGKKAVVNSHTSGEEVSAVKVSEEFFHENDTEHEGGCDGETLSVQEQLPVADKQLALLVESSSSDIHSESLEEKGSRPDSKKTKRRSITVLDVHTKLKRADFSLEEEAVLLDWVNRHGVGRWTALLQQCRHRFHPNRTALALQGKWEHLVKKFANNNTSVSK